MNKELIIVRHAKSDWGQSGLDDHDRTLNSRGLRDAPRMAEVLLERGISPTAILASTAVRAQTTARIFARQFGFPEGDLVSDHCWYHASPLTWLKTIQALPETQRTVLIFGHNPGLEELAAELLGSGTAVGPLVTCGVVRLKPREEIPWSAICPGSVELIEHLTPKSLES